jgi:diguanylate cyclase (GGDEF)-like protein/PAS domain S-box-containing protein
MDETLCSRLLDNLYDGVYYVDRERRITYWNKGAEKISGFKSTEVVGSYCYDNLLKHIDCSGSFLCTGDCPLARTIEDGMIREKEVFLYHKEGYRVPVHVRVYPMCDQNGNIMGAVEVFNDNSKKLDLAEQLEKFRLLSFVDPLTDLVNRRYMEIYLQVMLKSIKNYGRSFFGLLFLDIDHFKKINDTYGHNIGDNVLKMVAKTLKIGVLENEIAGRWGGEEFIMVVQAGNKDILSSIAQKIRILVQGSSLCVDSRHVFVTVSVGATMADLNDSVDSLIKRADRLMFQSKRSGRNTVSIA